MLSKEFPFAIDGRTNRRDYLKFLLLHLTFVVVATILGSNLSDMFISNASGAATTVTYLAAFLICLAALAILSVAAISVHVRRLHDMNLAGRMILIGLVPFLLLLICGIAPGTKGVNRYGSPIVSRWTGSPSAEQSGQLGS